MKEISASSAKKAKELLKKMSMQSFRKSYACFSFPQWSFEYMVFQIRFLDTSAWRPAPDPRDTVQTLVVTIQTLIEDRCDRTALVAANFLGSFDTALFQRFFDLCDQFLGVDGGKAQVKHTLDGNGKTEYQAEEHRKHPLPTAFEELLHQHLVHRLSFGKLSVRSRNFVHYGFFNDCGLLGCRRSRLLRSNSKDAFSSLRIHFA